MTDAPPTRQDSHLFEDIAMFVALRLRFSDPGRSEWHQRSTVIRHYCACSEFAPFLLFLFLAPARVYAQSGTQDEIEQLRKQVALQQTQMAAQQNQIDELRLMLLQQSKLLASISPPTPSATTVAPIGTPVAPAAAPELPKPASQAAENDRSPLAIGIGPIELTPTGF